MFFMDASTGQVVWLKFVETERLADHQEGLQTETLTQNNFTFLLITVDGRTGLKELASKYRSSANLPVL